MDLEVKSSTVNPVAMAKYHEQLAAQWRLMARESGLRPAHRDEARPVDVPEKVRSFWEAPEHLFELEVPEEPRIDLAAFLMGEYGWPAPFAAKNVPLFALAVYHRYVRVRGHEPEWAGGWVYRGDADWRIVRATADEELGALMEQVAAEGGQS